MFHQESTIRYHLFLQNMVVEISIPKNEPMGYWCFVIKIVPTYFEIGCLIELKFCEVSRNFFSNRCWKFNSILNNKKKIFLEKGYFLGRCQYQNKTGLFTDSIFSEGFAILLYIRNNLPAHNRWYRLVLFYSVYMTIVLHHLWELMITWYFCPYNFCNYWKQIL